MIRPALLLTLTLAAALPRTAAAETAEEYFASADGEIKSGRCDKARDFLEKASKNLAAEDPQRVLYLERMAYCAFSQNEFDEAQNLYTQAISLSKTLRLQTPVVADAFAGMGLTLAAVGKQKFSEKFLKESLVRNPSAETRALVEKKLAEQAASGAQKSRPKPSGVWKYNVLSDYLYYGQAISGSNAKASYLTPGHFGIENLNLSNSYTSTMTGTFMESAADLRIADESRIEAKRVNLKRLFVRFGNNENEAIIGDYLASLSQYSLGTSLKGARYTRKFGGSFDLTLLSGIPKAEWDDVWAHNRTETVDRNFYATRAVWRYMGDGSIGASHVTSMDNRAHLNTDAVRTYQRIEAIDWALPTTRGLSLRGESAYSKTVNDNPNGVPSVTHGWAHLVQADYGFKRFKSQNTFERVSPEYATTGGAASPDLIRARTQNQLRFKGPWSLKGSYSYFHNNLNHAQTNTSTTRLPEAGVRYDGPDWRPSFSAEAKVRHREVTSSRKGLRSRTRSVATGVADSFGVLDASADYEFQHEDKSDHTASLRHHILSLGTTAKFKSKSGYSFKPSVQLDIQRDRDNLTAKTDQATVTTWKFLLKFPWSMDVSFGYTRNLVQNAVDPGSERRSLNAVLGYNILKKEDWRFEARLRQNDNRFTRLAKDFKETVWEMNLRMQL